MDRWPVMHAFLAAQYRPDLALRDRDIFTWFFRAGGGDANVVSAWDGEQLVGMLGFVPDPIHWGRLGAPLSGAWLVNWAVDAAYRSGIGIALMRDVQMRFDVLLGVGAGIENERIVARLGWTIYPGMPRYLAVFDRAAAAALAFAGAALDGYCFAGAGDANGAGDWRPDAPQPAWEAYPALTYGTVRSPEYLRWRYLRHPTFRFSILAAGEDTAPALAVYRIERAAGSGALVGRVMEFFHPADPPGCAAGVGLAGALAARFAAAGCVFADFVGAAGAYGETLTRAGWTLEDPAAPVLPSRLQPVERTPFAYNLEYGVRRGLPQPAFDAIYATRGDGDADRPPSLR